MINYNIPMPDIVFLNLTYLPEDINKYNKLERLDCSINKLSNLD